MSRILAVAMMTAAMLAPMPAAAEDGRFTGTPRIGASDGWSIKPRGRLQLDTGHVSGPAESGGIGELRRAQLGLEGTAPGGFNWLVEAEFAEGIAEITEMTLTWKASDALSLTIGQHNNFQSLEELTSDRFSAFMERAAFTDAFNFERRLGLSAEIRRGALTAQVGVFGENLLEIDEADGAYSLDGRLVYAPEIGGTRLHLAASAHWRDNGDRADNTVASRFRVRPLFHATETRFVSSPALLADSETRFGLEAAVIRGPFHAVAEAQWLDLDVAAGAADRRYFGGYAEIGWFLTGETRGYRSARWERTRVRRPVETGGAGAFQMNLRYDRLDLAQDGTQDGLVAALIWIPTDHARLMVNYARLWLDDAAIPDAAGRRDYAVDMIGARVQFDF